MKRILYVFLIFGTNASGNPVSIYAVDPPHTMVAENVLVGVEGGNAVVFGTYRFQVTPNAREWYRDPPYKVALQLPVPLPDQIRGFEQIGSLVHPVLTIKGVPYFPNKEISSIDTPTLPKGIRLALFSYLIDRSDLGKKFDINIQYDQPMCEVAGKTVLIYVPFLPNFEEYRKSMHLNPHSYVIRFESYGGEKLRLFSTGQDLIQVQPTLISAYARDRQPIIVETSVTTIPSGR
ncbi:MAG TPA: hypothetical protein VGG34_00625 [Opitutaceae bacterium]|jgi:hypothetical protein